MGGGMFNTAFSSGTVTNCIFSENSASLGGGINNDHASQTLTNCTFSGNSAYAGGGIYNSLSDPVVSNCIFSGNTVQGIAGGIYNYQSSPWVTNCTFSGNSASDNSGGGGGMYNQTYSYPEVTNSILWGNIPNEIFDLNSSPSVTYSDIQGGYTGIGNINADPMFVDQANGDLHLQQGSPCIDAGNNSATALPTTDIDGDNRKIDDPKVADTGNGTPPIVDMGADEYVRKVMAMPWILLLLGD